MKQAIYSLMSDFDIAPENQLLSTLFTSSYNRLSPYIEEIQLTSGQKVHKSGEIVTEIYFPQTAIFSLVRQLSDGSSSQISLIGNEGLVGLPAILSDSSTTTDSVVQIPGTALKMPLEIINQEFLRGEELHSLLLLYTKTYIAHISHIAACNSIHNIEHRMARFLLSVQDCLQQEILPLTQKSISLMLGVRRASVTEIAILLLQKQQIIQYSRGKITILNRPQLEAHTCECYSKIKSEYVSLLRAKAIS